MSTDPKPVIMRITAVYEYELIPDLTERQRAYGTTDPAECAEVDAESDDEMMLISGADLKSFTIEAVGTKKASRPADSEVMDEWCPYCRAQRGEWCKDFAGGKALKLHATRIKAAGGAEPAKETAPITTADSL